MDCLQNKKRLRELHSAVWTGSIYGHKMEMPKQLDSLLLRVCCVQPWSDQLPLVIEAQPL